MRPLWGIMLSAALAIAAPFPAAMSGAVQSPAASAAYFVADPNVTRNLTPWQYFDTGRTFPVSAFPDGATSPGVVRVTNDPLGQQGLVYQETVTPTSRWPGGALRGDWTYLFNDQSAAYYGRNGQENWVHFRVMLPGGGAYVPTVGEWNWLHESHNDSKFLNFAGVSELPELAIGVANYAGAPYPMLFMRILGGQDLNPPPPTYVFDGSALRYDHWYDMVLHVIWSPDPSTGLVEWWMDGKLMYSHHVADLWQRPDGSYDQTEFELNNYRLHADWNSTVYYSKVAIGPTQASVDF
jgi:hypothetical protein